MRDNEEIFLLAMIWRFANRTNWGMERDILADIGWPAQPGDPAPKGQITLRIDWQGVATAELIARGPLPAVARTDVAAGSAKLIADFGFSAVRGFNNADEISNVLGAMELLKRRAPQVIDAVRGVELLRVPVIQSPTGPLDGEFDAGITESTRAASRPNLKLADRAFAAVTQTRFAGGGPISPSVPAIFQIVAHEVGHAVETKEYREAYDKYVEESAKYEATQQDVAEEERVTRARVAPRGRRAAKKFWDEQSERYRINNERKAEAQRHVEAAKSQKERAQVTTSTPQVRTRRMQKFIDLVNANNISPFTPYAARQWRANEPRDFYADAYSLWMVDPDFLRTNYVVVFNFFQSGDYLR